MEIKGRGSNAIVASSRSLLSELGGAELGLAPFIPNCFFTDSAQKAYAELLISPGLVIGNINWGWRKYTLSTESHST